MMTVSAVVRLMPVPPARVEMSMTSEPVGFEYRSMAACRSRPVMLPSMRSKEKRPSTR